MRKIAKGVVFAVALALCGPAFAVNDPDELTPGKLGLVKLGILGKFVAKPTGTFNLPTSAIATGSLKLFDTSIVAGTNIYPLTPGTWHRLPASGTLTGWHYIGAGTPADPCTSVLIKTTVIKAVCRGAGIALSPPFSGNLGVVLNVGPSGSSKTYCTTFGGTPVKNQASLFKRINAPAPGACPTVAVPTTTSTSSSTTSSTSSTTSTTVGSPSGAFLE